MPRQRNVAAYPLASDLAGLLVGFAQEHGIADDDPLMKTVRGYGQRQLTMANWIAHLDELAERTNTPEIGLLLGQRVTVAHGGVLAYLVLSCDNLAEALRQFERYQRILYGGAGRVSARGDTIRVTYDPGDMDVSRSDEVLLSGMLTFVRDITGRDDLRPAEVGFFHDEPDYAPLFRQIFGDNIHFSCPALYFEFSIQALGLPIAKGDGALQKILQSQAESLLSVFTRQDEFDQQLQKGIIDLMQEGHTCLADLARVMRYSERTLQRRLEARGMNFTDLFRETRREMAAVYLKDEALSLTDISFLLAYSEQSAFTRAFKQWYGMSPSAWRKAHRLRGDLG